MLTSRWRGLALLLAAFLPLILWRARLESSFWLDEVYSALLTSFPHSRLVELTALDSHPPGYYLLLKAWLKLARLAGFEPGVFWGRLLGVGAWVGLAGSAWFGGRRLLGSRWGVPFAWLVAGGAYAAVWAKELRSYAIAHPALLVAFLCLVLLAREDRPPSRREAAGLWLAYLVAAAAALWTHLLSVLALALLVALWSVAVLGRPAAGRSSGRSSGRLLAAGGLVQVGVLAAFLPWLLTIRRQLHLLEAGDTSWMTPPTAGNLLAVFTFWYPFGRIGDPAAPGHAALQVAGALSTALPLALAVWALLHRRPGGDLEAGGWLRAGALGAATAAGFVIVIWTLARLGAAPTFHGPRYPGLVAVLWLAGLALMGLGAGRALGWRPGRSSLALLPLLACSVTGQWLLARQEAGGGLAAALEVHRDLLPAPGSPLYVMPPELGPFYRRSLAEFDVRRIEELPCAAAGAPSGDRATVLDLGFWGLLDRPRDHIVEQLVRSRTFSRSVEEHSFPAPRHDYLLFRLDGLEAARLRSLCSTGWASRATRRLASAPSKALPETQTDLAHWSFLEIEVEASPDGAVAIETFRWATGPLTPLIFDAPLPAGRYVLHVEGVRQPHPREAETLALALDGTGVRHQEVVAPGRFQVAVPVALERPLRRPLLQVAHPTWSPAAVGRSADRRRLAFALSAAWFEAAE